MFTDADVIYSYTRAQALSDGVLVDVTQSAQEAGFKVPVALTSAVYGGCVEWTEHDEQTKAGSGQSQQGRLSDVLWMAYQAARRTDGSQASFTMLRVPREGEGQEATEVGLVVTIHPGDQGEPVCTILCAGED